MSKVLDFNKVKKNYLTTTLPGEAGITILITTPTKRILDELIAVEDTFKDIDESATKETLTDLYKLTAKVMSQNKGGVKISTEQLEDSLDVEDLLIFYNSYMEFISEITNSKN